MFPMPGDPQAPGMPYPAPGAPYLPGNPGVPEGPLGGLQNSVANILNAADSHHLYLPTGPGGPVLQVPRGRRPSVLRDMAYGGAAGFVGALVWRAMKRRKARKGEYTHPVFRFLAIWWLFMLTGFGLCLWRPLETGWFLGTTFMLGTVASFAYMAYRAAGGGRYNTRRRGSPFRADHEKRS